MGESLFVPERQTKILMLLQQQGRVSVSELGDLFGVSAVTIRNDLSELERRGELLRTHGGAILPSRGDVELAFNLRSRMHSGAILPSRGDVELAFNLRSRMHSGEKAAIGMAAAQWIGDGEAVILDASTTALQVARHIGPRRELTVITNSLMVAVELAGVAGVTVVLTGGVLRSLSYSLVGEMGNAVLDRFNVSKGFFGAKGLTVEEGLTDADNFEVQFKRLMVAASKEVIAVVDGSKWGQVATASFAAVDQLHLAITDPSAPREIVERLRARGTRVQVAAHENNAL